MIKSPSSLLITLLVCLAAAGPLGDPSVHRHITPRAAEAAALPSNVHVLQRHVVPPSSHLLTQTFPTPPDLAGRDEPPGVGRALKSALLGQAFYLTDVQASGQHFWLRIDTQATETWFVKDNFVCLDCSYREVPYSQCGFGPGLRGKLSGGLLPDRVLGVLVGEYEKCQPWLNGDMGFSDLTFAGITLPEQQVGIANEGTWDGDGVSSGVLGLGLPGLFTSHHGDIHLRCGLGSLADYSPVVNTMGSHLQQQVFSLSLSRDDDQSFLAVGGIPPEVKTGPFVATPILKTFGLNEAPDDYFHYFIQVESMWLNNTSGGSNSTTTDEMFIVNSDFRANQLPYKLAEFMNSGFSPPAYPIGDTWFVECGASAPSVGVQIGGQVLWADPRSMLRPEIKHRNSGWCATGIEAVYGPPYVLGESFMQGLVSVFDVGSKEMRFAQRI
ncbi:Acid protease [Pleurostoma richardsiae]|uniref:Acid protease n=1 Tax=Pleurostoma richardsiae TaxID=41990 RepID=A0AA38R953_9PEZI|nr:Acid protease [Pleurostoma richardsiae]